MTDSTEGFVAEDLVTQDVAYEIAYRDVYSALFDAYLNRGTGDAILKVIADDSDPVPSVMDVLELTQLTPVVNFAVENARRDALEDFTKEFRKREGKRRNLLKRLCEQEVRESEKASPVHAHIQRRNEALDTAQWEQHQKSRKQTEPYPHSGTGQYL